MAGGFGKPAAPKKGFGAAPAAAAKNHDGSPKAAARTHQKLCDTGALSTNVYVRPAHDTDSDWLLVGAVSVGEGGSLMQAAHGQRRLVLSHSTKMSKRLAIQQVDGP